MVLFYCFTWCTSLSNGPNLLKNRRFSSNEHDRYEYLICIPWRIVRYLHLMYFLFGITLHKNKIRKKECCIWKILYGCASCCYLQNQQNHNQYYVWYRFMAAVCEIFSSWLLFFQKFVWGRMILESYWVNSKCIICIFFLVLKWKLFFLYYCN